MRVLRSRPVLLLLVGVVVVSALNVTLALTRGEPPSVAASTRLPDESRAAVEAAATALPLSLTYDYRDLQGSLRTATTAMTERFAREFVPSFRATAVPQARRAKQVTDAVVRRTGLVRTADGGRRVLCLLYVDQRVLRSAGRPEGPPVVVRRSSVAVEMVRSGDRWLIDDIAPV